MGWLNRKDNDPVEWNAPTDYQRIFTEIMTDGKAMQRFRARLSEHQNRDLTDALNSNDRAAIRDLIKQVY